jgi:hypothetical protein
VEENFFMVCRNKGRDIADREKRGDQALCGRRRRRRKVCRLAHLARGFRLSLGMRVKRDLGKKQNRQHCQREGKNPHQVTRAPAVTKHRNVDTLPQFEVGRYRACLVSKPFPLARTSLACRTKANVGFSGLDVVRNLPSNNQLCASCTVDFLGAIRGH